VYATPDLSKTTEEVAAALGVRPVPGGRHVGLGTRNELLALGDGSYLEIIGPDEEQEDPAQSRPFGIDRLDGPKLVAWAVRADDLDALVADARAHAYDPGDPIDMARSTPTGETLRWRLTLPVGEETVRVIPFAIDWGTSTHPSTTSPTGAELVSLEAGHPDPDRVRVALVALGTDLALRASDVPQLRAVVRGPAGLLELV
jgi:hypothetical protein